MAETVQAAVASRADLHGADLRGADLSRAKLTRANLSGALISSANLFNADLSGAHLMEANLIRAHFFKADLHGADLSRATLSSADLTRANLTRANLSGADLSGAKLYEANLHGADLNRAQLTVADLIGTDLSKTDLSGALFLRTMLSCDLIGAANLESSVHGGPSPVSHETLRAFQGKVPEVFLRGCGLLPWEIESAKLYDPDLTAVQIQDITLKIFDTLARSPVQRHSIFLSYAHDDAKFVDRLQQRMYAAGLNTWRDIHDAPAGPLDQVIKRAIRVSDIVLPILSANSVHKPWLQFEVETAVKRQVKTGEKVLCPISLDDTWLDSERMPGPLLTQLKTFNVLPFENWEDDGTFETMYRRLQRGIVEFYPFATSGDGEEAAAGSSVRSEP